MKTDEVLKEAAGVLRNGGVILYPTDTVWGLGCDATDPEAVARVFAIKRRNEAKSLVLLASDLDMVARYVKQIPNIAIDLVEVNDKPMTLIYPGAICGSAPEVEAGGQAPAAATSILASLRLSNADSRTCPAGEKVVRTSDKYHLAWNVVAEDGSVGMRIPMMDFCRELVRKLGRPLVSTSANISGEPTPRRFAEITEEIRTAVDYCVPAPLERGSTGSASQIIKLGLGGEVEIIRA